LRTRRSKKIVIYATIVGLVAVVVTSSVWFASYRFYNAKLLKERSSFEKQLEEQNKVIQQYESRTKVGYVLRNDLSAGSTISENDVERISLPDYFVPDNIISTKDEIIGKVIKINAHKGTAITQEMVYKNGILDPSARKEESQFIKLPIRVSKGDTVDIRIVFPNGEDYIVVAKKKLQDVDAAKQQAFFEVTEEEIMLLQSALVDAYMNSAEIYMKQYVEPEMQPKPDVTYVPNVDVIHVIETNPQIIEKAKYSLMEKVRKSLEERLANIDPTKKVRVGADAPYGSGVSKRIGSDGATINPERQQGIQGGVSDIVKPPQPSTGATIQEPQNTNQTDPIYPEAPPNEVPQNDGLLGG
jgi:hypothetical protein